MSASTHRTRGRLPCAAEGSRRPCLAHRDLLRRASRTVPCIATPPGPRPRPCLTGPLQRCSCVQTGGCCVHSASVGLGFRLPRHRRPLTAGLAARFAGPRPECVPAHSLVKVRSHVPVLVSWHSRDRGQDCSSHGPSPAPGTSPPAALGCHLRPSPSDPTVAKPAAATHPLGRCVLRRPREPLADFLRDLQWGAEGGEFGRQTTAAVAETGKWDTLSQWIWVAVANENQSVMTHPM